jgi:hypothetical protein
VSCWRIDADASARGFSISSSSSSVTSANPWSLTSIVPTDPAIAPSTRTFIPSTSGKASSNCATTLSVSGAGLDENQR